MKRVILKTNQREKIQGMEIAISEARLKDKQTNNDS